MEPIGGLNCSWFQWFRSISSVERPVLLYAVAMKIMLVAVLFTFASLVQAEGLCEKSDSFPTDGSPIGKRVACAKVSMAELARVTGANIAPGFPDQLQIWIWTDDSEAAAFLVDVTYDVIQEDGSAKEITHESVARRIRKPEWTGTAYMDSMLSLSLEAPADRIIVRSINVQETIVRGVPIVIGSTAARAPVIVKIRRGAFVCSVTYMNGIITAETCQN